jgi:uncharacterized protein (TIGR02145 family)
MPGSTIILKIPKFYLMKNSNKIWLLLLFVAGVALMLADGCKKDLPPELTTSPVYKIMDNAAYCDCTVNDDAGSAVTERGVCWATTASPTTGNFKTTNGDGTGTCECCLDSLLPNTTYYVRAYAINGNGTGYGNEEDFITPPNVTDIDGNVYHTVSIGNQVWMAGNLKVTHYRNGEEIPEVTGASEWINLTTGAYCAINPAWADIYGKFYNGYAVNDSRNLAPAGWHVPGDGEWKILEGTVDSEFHGGDAEWDKTEWRGSDAGGNLKSTNNYWYPPNIGATDKYGFTALPGGARHNYSGQFMYQGYNAVFWTSTPDTQYVKWFWARSLVMDDAKIQRLSGSYTWGVNVRCVKD